MLRHLPVELGTALTACRTPGMKVPIYEQEGG
jgi:hypothetical protein